MKRITTDQASEMMGVAVQGVRKMIQLGKIPGAFCYGPKYKRTYYITDEQVKNLMKGDTR